VQKKHQSAKKLQRAEEERSQLDIHLNNIYDNVIDNVIERGLVDADRERRLDTPSPTPCRLEGTNLA
jgi:hypothetical protein